MYVWIEEVEYVCMCVRIDVYGLHIQNFGIKKHKTEVVEKDHGRPSFNSRYEMYDDDLCMSVCVYVCCID